MKRKLDEAFDQGHSTFEEGSIEFLGIRQVDRNPRDDSANRPGGFRDSLALLGFALVALLFIALLLAGLFQIWSWLT